jgi:predicted DNA-binding protein (UPF0251 family)
MKPKKAKTTKVVKPKLKKARYPMKNEPTKIAKDDQIIQADAARILGVSRERVSQLVKSAKLKFTVVTTPRGEEKYVSAKQCKSIADAKAKG